MPQAPFTEKRREPREHATDKVLWRVPGRTAFEQGWMLERSARGMAFAWRGAQAPQEGGVILVQRTHEGRVCLPERAIVRRVAHAHEDLYVIGVETLQEPPTHYVAAEGSLIEPRPMAAKVTTHPVG